MSTENEPTQQLITFQQVLDELKPGPAHACSYLPDRQSRNVALRIANLPPGVYQALMDLNFRRCGSVFYRPTCEQCQECRALRVLTEPFQPSRSQQRCWRRNEDLSVQISDPEPTKEKHVLYQRYLKSRHAEQMSDAWEDFCSFLYTSPVRTAEVIYRLDRKIVAVGILDVEPRAVSTVYCYFDPELAERSLGTYNVLWTIYHSRQQQVPYVYLGYYIADCSKMNYKADYKPCEILDTDHQWRISDAGHSHPNK